MNSIVEWLAYFAEKKPDKIAVIAEDQAITYKELWNEAAAFSEYLKKIGIKKGDRVLHSASHSISFAVLCFAIHLCGAVNVPVEHSLKEKGIEDIAQKLDVSLVITESQIPGSHICFDITKVRETAQQNKSTAEAYEFPKSADAADILFTTGTTGASKGVMLSHRAILAVAENVVHGAEMTEDTVYLVPVPINHAGGIRKLYSSVITGGTTVLINGFANVKRFFDTIEKYKVTAVLMPPSAIRMILTLSGDKIGEYSGQINYIHTGSAAFPEADKERLSSLLPGAKLIFAYGSSESGCVSMFDYNANKGLVSCVGKPNINADIRIFDEDMKETASSRDNPGIIAIAGDMNMIGYYNDPERTAQVKHGDYIVTSDLGYFDENGFLYMVGRRDDVINIGGLKIAPTEVENEVLRYPGVAECACCAVADRMGGNVPKLLIVAEKDREIDTADLRKFLGAKLESYKVPKIITVTDSIPHTANGKIDRKKLS